MGTIRRITARVATSALTGLALTGVTIGTASAAPIDLVVTTTCTWPQIVAATYSVSPEEGDALANSAIAGRFAQFLSLPPAQRRPALDYIPGGSDRINDAFGGPGGRIGYTVFETCSSF